MSEKINPDYNPTFGQLLAHHRNKAGLNQVELAKHVGVSQKAIGAYENGDIFPRNSDKLQKIIECLLLNNGFTVGSEEKEARSLWRKRLSHGDRSFAPFNSIWFAEKLEQVRSLRTVSNKFTTAHTQTTPNIPPTSDPTSTAPVSMVPTSTAPVSMVPTSTAPVSMVPTSTAPNIPPTSDPIPTAPAAVTPVSIVSTTDPVSTAPAPTLTGPSSATLNLTQSHVIIFSTEEVVYTKTGEKLQLAAFKLREGSNNSPLPETSVGCFRDSKSGWKAVFELMTTKDEDKLNDVLSYIQYIDKCYYDDDKFNTFRNLLHGLFEFIDDYIESCTTNSTTPNAKYIEIHTKLRDFIFHFKARPMNPDRTLTITLDLVGKEILSPRFELDDYNRAPENLWSEYLSNAYQNRKEQINYIIHNYDDLKKNIESSDPNTKKAFLEFSKGLIYLIESTLSDARIYASRIPDISSHIILNEIDNSESPKFYLKKILNIKQSERSRRSQLEDIVTDIRDKYKNTSDNSHLLSIISLMSEHYLNSYDITGAVDVWDGFEKKDRTLQAIISIYRSPHKFVIAGLILFTIISVLAFFNTHNFYDENTKNNIIFGTSIFLIILFLTFTLLIVWTGFRLLILKNIYYSHFFLPRLLGAVVVGVTALFLQDIAWHLGLLNEVINWSIGCLIVYSLSFGYIYFEVYNTVKFTETPSNKTHLRVGKRNMVYALEASKKIFFIGLIEAFIGVLITSTLFAPAINLKKDNSTDLIDKDLIGGIISSPGKLLAFNFYPALIIFWTGIVLFIGGFVQLVWQDKSITSSNDRN